jgi:hypothetical protein
MTWRTLLALAALAGCTTTDRLLEVGGALDAGRDQASDDAALLPGSSPCGPAGDRCSVSASCTYCSASGQRQACTCAPSGLWECTPTGGTCGVACGPRNCLPDEICRGLQVTCAITPVGLPLLYDCVRRPDDCPAPAGCSCLATRACPTTSPFCREVDAGSIECRCRP